MSSFKNAQKSNQKQHRERGQLQSRRKYGLLEKKKDYKERADDYQRKQKTIKTLKRQAQDRNPDEFYFNMVNTRLEDGVHQSKDETPVYTEEQLKLMTSQDARYVNYKISCEIKKIERLKACLHMLEDTEKAPNKHTVFVDTEKEEKEFDAATHFDTHPALVSRKFNRPNREMLKSDKQLDLAEETIVSSVTERRKQYKELKRREERLKQLRIIADKLHTKQVLSDPKQPKRQKVKDETKSSAAVYKFAPQRKR